MKKLIAWSVPFFIVMPAVGMAAVCTSYGHEVASYALETPKANGTLTKTQICTGNGDKGTYVITSEIDVSKFGVSRTIKQIAAGTYAAPNTIVAQTFQTSADKDAALISGDLDTLSLVLYLSSSLSAGITTFPVVPLFYNDQTVLVQCSVTDANTTVPSSAGKSLPATTLVCATKDNAVVLTYSFSQDPLHIMLAANAVEKGETTMSAVIN